jgi:hypothetical protein
MVTNISFNREVVRTIAFALRELNEQVVFVGGAITGLYINDPAADDVDQQKMWTLALPLLR